MKLQKGLNKKSGIYSITNEVNGKIYIGRSKNLYRRYSQYIYSFKNLKNGHINCYLMSSMLKYGFHNFRFDCVELCDNTLTEKRELFWINKLKTTDRHIGYNLRLDVNGNMKVSPSTSLKISERMKKEWSDGSRNSHSSKLKVAWLKRDKSLQSKLMRKILSKWVYLVDGEPCDYQTLKIKNLKSVISKFHRNKTNEVFFKNVRIERILI